LEEFCKRQGDVRPRVPTADFPGLQRIGGHRDAGVPQHPRRFVLAEAVGVTPGFELLDERQQLLWGHGAPAIMAKQRSGCQSGINGRAQRCVWGLRPKGKLELSRAFSNRILASGIRLPVPIPVQGCSLPFGPSACPDVVNQRAGHHQTGLSFGQVPESTPPFFGARNHNV
jgi:hypothetical protein